jgi:hypothetical protein
MKRSWFAEQKRLFRGHIQDPLGTNEKTGTGLITWRSQVQILPSQHRPAGQKYKALPLGRAFLLPGHRMVTDDRRPPARGPRAARLPGR